jgi:hypothetical protein
MVEYCEFCELLVFQLRIGSGFFSEYPGEVREQILESMNRASPVRENEEELKKIGPLMPVTAFCRGFGLCNKHSNTIKSDNKLRAKKDMDIPSDLSIIGNLRLYDW